jgi:hypothetical protein
MHACIVFINNIHIVSARQSIEHVGFIIGAVASVAPVIHPYVDLDDIYSFSYLLPDRRMSTPTSSRNPNVLT